MKWIENVENNYPPTYACTFIFVDLVAKMSEMDAAKNHSQIE